MLKASNIDASAIMLSYPELRSYGITEDALNRLAVRVPNLQQRIQKHFVNREKLRVTLERNRELNDRNSRLYSSPEFLNQFNKYLGKHETVAAYSPPAATPTSGLSSFTKPPGIDEHPCRRSGACLFPEPLFQKPPHALAPKPDVWIKDAFLVPTGIKDDTKLTPDHLMPVGPDPRYSDYYQSYIEGHPNVFYPALPAPPPPPTSYPTAPNSQSTMIDLQTTLENVPHGATIESETYLTQEPTFPHGGPYQWTPFSVCSVTCGQGEKKRFRRCSQQDCPSGGVEIETAVCMAPDCPGWCNNKKIVLFITLMQEWSSKPIYFHDLSVCDAMRINSSV